MSKRILLLALLLWSATRVEAGLSRLEALGMIESGDNDAAVGQFGEVSRYQIKPRIWRQYSESLDYQNRVVARHVAQRHMDELVRTFCQGARRDPTDFDLYVLWNAGPTYYRSIGWTRGKVCPVVRDRAQRYVNLREAPNLAMASPARASGSGSAGQPPPLLPFAMTSLATEGGLAGSSSAWADTNATARIVSSYRSFSLETAGNP